MLLIKTSRPRPGELQLREMEQPEEGAGYSTKRVEASAIIAAASSA